MPPKPLLACLALLAALLVWPDNVFAWNAAGHRTAAAVAWAGLSPQARAEAARLLAAHPRYQEDLLAGLPAAGGGGGGGGGGVEAGEWAFATAAAWPDVIRDDAHPMHDRDRPAWHYVNYPFAPDGDDRGFPAPDAAWSPGQEPANALQAIEKVRHDLSDRSLPDAERAVALCWYLHLVADVHQPLHATALVSAEHPRGDRGGNGVFVLDDGRAINLHAYWDGRLGRTWRPEVLEWLANRVAEETPADTVDADVKSPDAYARESADLAKYYVYLGGALPMATTEAAAKELPADYGRVSAMIARRRVAQAGYRVAADLDALLAATAPATTTPATRPRAGSVTAASSIVLDGRFDDWAGRGDAGAAQDDPAGDAVGGPLAIDVTRLAATADGTALYLELSQATATNLSKGPQEAGTLKVTVAPADASAEWPGVEIDLRNRAARLLSARGTPGALVLPWQVIGFEALPTYASDKAEMRVDLTQLGARPGERVKISVGGSDELASPLTVRLGDAATRPPPGGAEEVARANGTDIRLASMNLLWGLADDGDRTAATKRLLAATMPDVIAFQEARKAEEATALLNEGWNVVADNESCVVASRWPLRAVAVPEPLRAAAAVIAVPGRPATLVLSLHLKCCGYIGSREDEKRTAQAEALANLIRKLRAGELVALDGQPVLAAARVIVAGDWNLVGGEQPLLEVAGPAAELGMTALLPLRTGAPSAATWRALDERESFWPGRLDVVVHGNGLLPLKSFLLDTSTLAQDARQTLGVLHDDSRASDHLMTVADFQVQLTN